MEVDVEVERGAEALHDVAGSGPGTGEAVAAGAGAVVGADRAQETASDGSQEVDVARQQEAQTPGRAARATSS